LNRPKRVPTITGESAAKRMARIERQWREMDAGNYYTKEQVEAMLKADGLLP